ncbi:pyrimidine 5'-nucleotidase [Ferruginivarius sediminum]|uniref:Pyrimidine 5'-nucleotidase n=1 Tax=Ferruginivarius sediminum TaxID=2661937 RepID=A0A369T746_9PROT|nr:pyrimidine 5'-nucleotidase [Ferruginivarius sediminum]RDD61098.1 pyrimidine 5'-nucleotidase [Ferruginivarius sediminum]
MTDETIWLFDLDNTLYPASCRLFDQVDRRMGEFVQQALGLANPAEARKIQKDYLRDHGTTLRGLMDVHGIAPDDYLDYVHAIDVSAVQPDPNLDAALAALPGRKLIFTNGSENHAVNVMDRLGVAHHFEAIFDIAAADYVPKPARGPYDQLIVRHGLRPEATVFFDDMPRNLEPAAELGMTTVWVANDSEWALQGHTGAEDFVHHVTDDLAGWLRSNSRI